MTGSHHSVVADFPVTFWRAYLQLVADYSVGESRDRYGLARGLSPTFRPSLPECYGTFSGSEPSQHVEMVSSA